MTLDKWDCVDNFTADVAGDNADKELGKLLAFLRRRSDKGEAAVREFDQFLDLLVKSGPTLAYSNQTVSYFKRLKEAKDKHLRDIKDPAELIWIMGWAKRLAKVYQHSELAQGGVPVTSTPDRRTEAERLKDSPFAVLAKAQEEKAAQQAVAEKAKPLFKRGQKVTVTVVDAEGKEWTADYQGVTVKFARPTFGELGPHKQVEVELQSEQPGAWRAKFAKYK